MVAEVVRAHASIVPPVPDCESRPSAVVDDRKRVVQEGREEEADALDVLTKQYEEEAKQQLAASQVSGRKSARLDMGGRRSEGLATPLGADNKGFKLLASMGYKAGQGIGKGRAEPINLSLKAGRKGLGVEEGMVEARKRKEAEQEHSAAVRLHQLQECQDEYKGVKAAAYTSRTTQRHLADARRAAQALDEQNGKGESLFWPKVPSESEAEGEAGMPAALDPWEALSPEEQLRSVLQHLRNTYCYCMFCGLKYDNQEDLQANCPGPLEEDH